MPIDLLNLNNEVGSWPSIRKWSLYASQMVVARLAVDFLEADFMDCCGMHL